MKFHREVLGTTQHRVLRRLGTYLTPENYYLVGGTALAAQLGHRRSVDLDWFTPQRLRDPLRLAQALRDAGLSFRTTQVAQGTLHGTVGGLRASILEYRYPLLRPLVQWPAFRCRLASLEDLAAMKLSALAQRGAKKDFVDLYALGTRHASLGQMVGWYQEKFSVPDIAHVLYSLVYFEEADRERMPPMFWDADWRAIKKAIRQWVQQYPA